MKNMDKIILAAICLGIWSFTGTCLANLGINYRNRSWDAEMSGDSKLVEIYDNRADKLIRIGESIYTFGGSEVYKILKNN